VSEVDDVTPKANQIRLFESEVRMESVRKDMMINVSHTHYAAAAAAIGQRRWALRRPNSVRRSK
jgi:hypothetical protein